MRHTTRRSERQAGPPGRPAIIGDGPDRATTDGGRTAGEDLRLYSRGRVCHTAQAGSAYGRPARNGPPVLAGDGPTPTPAGAVPERGGAPRPRARRSGETVAEVVARAVAAAEDRRERLARELAGADLERLAALLLVHERAPRSAEVAARLLAVGRLLAELAAWSPGLYLAACERTGLGGQACGRLRRGYERWRAAELAYEVDRDLIDDAPRRLTEAEQRRLVQLRGLRDSELAEAREDLLRAADDAATAGTHVDELG